MQVSQKLPNVQLQVDKLESAGFEVVLTHRPDAVQRHAPAVGETLVHIIDSGGYPVGIGNALCSKQDNFNRVTGTRIAFRRAIADFYSTVGHVKAGAVLYPEGTRSTK